VLFSGTLIIIFYKFLSLSLLGITYQVQTLYQKSVNKKKNVGLTLEVFCCSYYLTSLM